MILSFSEAWAVLAREDRTDRAKALIGLVALGALPGAKWVAAGEVFDTIRLHLRGAAPQNTSDVLRKVGADVTPKRSEDGGLLWQLTATGLARLTAWGVVDGGGSNPKLHATSTPDAPANSQPKRRFDIAILCALTKPELSAVYTAFGGKSKWQPLVHRAIPRTCRETRMPVMTGGDVSIVASVTTTMGLTATAIAASQIISEFRPSLIVMIGIAAGTIAKNRDFGDILVPDPSIDYATGKLVERDGKRILEPDPYPIPINSRLKSLLQTYLNSEEPFEEIRRDWMQTGDAPPLAPKLHIGPVGAADQVVDAESIVREIKKNWRKLIGVEMETYGLYRAAHESGAQPLFLAFKSVCDFATGKTDDWQPYAAYTAAQFSRYFIARHWAEIVDIKEGN